MQIFYRYWTPLWTVVGVLLGFGLSLLFYLIVERIRRKKRIQETIERIKKSMHLSDSKQAIRRMADLIPQFREKEQIEMLDQLGLESALNTSTDDVTKCIIEELRWLSVSYEASLADGDVFIDKPKEDKKRVRSIHSTLWNIAMTLVEYRQSKKLLGLAFDLFEILDSYAINQNYVKVILDSIEFYKYVGKYSVGMEYGVSGYSVSNFKFGIDGSIKQLSSLRESISKSSFEESKVSRFLHAIDYSINLIEKERLEKIHE